jgi:branched-chain amino acid transport system ATP-binding protein
MLLEIENLTKSFGGVMAIAGVSFGIEQGTIHAVIGPNGAGKTTLFHAITGYHRPDSGRVVFMGEDITGLSSHQICRKGVGRSFQIINIYPSLSVFQNVQAAILSRIGKGLNFFSPAKNMGRNETEEILDLIGLYEQKQIIANALSHGDKKRLEVAIALGNQPKLLLLDEPTAGMSLEETTAIIHLIGKLCQEKGLTVFFTEHDMSVVFSIARRIIVMHQGKIIAEGSREDVKNNKQVQKVYLGEE